MESNVSLEEIYSHPVVAEILEENRQLRNLSERPDVKDLKDVPIPFTISKHLVINEGTHNGTTYSAQMLRLALDQHEGLHVYEDHQDTKGAAVQTWVGALRNPVWSEADKGILADVDIVDPKYAMAIAYGAKFGLSATVNVDIIKSEGKELANDPIFQSYSLVVDPAVRETMLNENQGEENTMGEELDIASDLKPAISKLEDAIRRASAMKDTSLKTLLEQVKAIVAKPAGKAYPYPKPGKLDEESEARLAALEALANIQRPSEPSGSAEAELEAVLKVNQEMKERLQGIDAEKLSVQTESILKKELEIGLLASTDSEARKKELSVMRAGELGAIEQNLDRTIAILETDAGDSKPDPAQSVAPSTESTKKELSADEQSKKADRALLDYMMQEQNKNSSKVGGF